MMLFGAVFDVILPIEHVSLTLDCVTSLPFINVRNTCKRLRYCQTFGGISFFSAMAELGRIRRIQLSFFHCFLCARIEIDQL